MPVEDSNFMNGIRLPRDVNDNPATLLVGLVDTDAGGHFVTAQFDPVSGNLNSQSTTRTPVYFLMLDHIITPTPTIPASQLTVPYSAVGCSQLIIDVLLSGVGSYVNLEPIVWNSVLGAYIPGGTSGRITATQRFILDIQSPDDIYLLPIEVSGTVSVSVAGI